MWTAGLGAQSVSSPCWAASVLQCLWECVTLQLKQMLFLYRENNDGCRKCCIQHLASGNAYSWDGNCWFRLLSFPCEAAFFSSPILLSHLSLCVCLETDWLLGKDLKERSMGRKARRSPQWNSEMQMVPLTPRESGDFVIVAACLNIMEMLFSLLVSAEHTRF